MRARRVVFHLASSYPYRGLFERARRRLVDDVAGAAGSGVAGATGCGRTTDLGGRVAAEATATVTSCDTSTAHTSLFIVDSLARRTGDLVRGPGAT